MGEWIKKLGDAALGFIDDMEKDELQDDELVDVEDMSDAEINARIQHLFSMEVPPLREGERVGKRSY